MQGIGGALAGRDVHDPTDGPAVPGSESTRIEVDAIEELGVDDGGASPEVIEDRNGDAIHLGVGLARGGAADDQLAGDVRRPGDARQVLQHPDRIPE